MAKQIYNTLTKEIHGSEKWVKSGAALDYDYSSDKIPNQFLLLLKPEAINVNSNSDVLGILNLVFTNIQKFDIHTNRIRILKGSFILENKVLETQYSILSLVSDLGYLVNSNSVRHKIDNYVSTLSYNPIILGGNEFLRLYNNFSPFTLSVLSDNLGTVKLGSGIYVTNIELTGKKIIILNPFYPFQAKWFTNNNSTVIAIECFSYKPWSYLRKNFAGYIEPKNALQHSLRRELFDKKDELEITSISKCFNFIHISPGPIEAAFQIEKYFYDNRQEHNNISKNILGQALLNRGFNNDFLERLGQNPEVLYNGDKKHLFEHTEDMDIIKAVNLIGKIQDSII